MNDANAALDKKPKRTKKAKPPALVLAPEGALPLRGPLAYSGAVLSGLLYWLAFAGWDVWPLAFVALAPLWVSIHRQPARRATLLGLVSGLTMNVFGFYWLQGMLKTFSGFPAPICFLFVLIVCAYQGGRMALFGWLYARATARRWPVIPVLVAAFAASELVYPLLFPWYFAATVHQIPVMTQVAELGGPILVGIVLLAANIAVAEPLLARLEARRMRVTRIAGGLVVTAAAAGFGLLRIGMVDSAVAASPEAKVGLVQANMSLFGKRHDLDEGLRRHLTLTDQLRNDDKVDFVVWSETSVMSAVPERAAGPIIQQNVSHFLKMPAIFGAVLYGPAPPPAEPGDVVMYNTALSSDPSGFVNGRYDKEFLLAFGEYLPFGETFPILYKWSPNSGRFHAGTKLDPLTIALGGQKHPVTMLICYEDILPSFTNAAVRNADPELLVNMTNDAWFGDTTEPWEHLALAQLRAIEHRRYLVRSTNSGISAIVDPVGRVVAHTSPFKEEALAGTIRWMRARTVYEAIGDIPFWLLTLGVVVGAFMKNKRVAAGA